MRLCVCVYAYVYVVNDVQQKEAKKDEFLCNLASYWYENQTFSPMSSRLFKALQAIIEDTNETVGPSSTRFRVRII